MRAGRARVAERMAQGRQMERHPNGGLRFTNNEVLLFQRKVVWDYAKEVGWNIATGNIPDLVSTSLPVGLCEPRSFLQRLSDGWHHIGTLDTAAAATDPVERFKSVIAFAIGGLKDSASQWKPFNPILGETYESEYPNGTRVFAEQTSHHPPISHWQVESRDRSYVYTGYAQWKASLAANALKGERLGINTVTFHDGGVVKFKIPYLYLRGVLTGERIVEYYGDLEIVDEANHLSATIVFNPDYVGYLGSFWKTAETPADHFRGPIMKNKRLICDCSGSWISELCFDGDLFYDFSTAEVMSPSAIEGCLPSDSRYRSDVISLEIDDVAASGVHKHELETIQRNDRTLRARYGPQAVGSESH